LPLGLDKPPAPDVLCHLGPVDLVARFLQPTPLSRPPIRPETAGRVGLLAAVRELDMKIFSHRMSIGRRSVAQSAVTAVEKSDDDVTLIVRHPNKMPPFGFFSTVSRPEGRRGMPEVFGLKPV